MPTLTVIYAFLYGFLLVMWYAIVFQFYPKNKDGNGYHDNSLKSPEDESGDDNNDNDNWEDI